MTFDRSLWFDCFMPTSVPRFACPRCDNGTLKLLDKFSIVESTYSKNWEGSEDWEPFWAQKRFTGYLQCDDERCGEIACVAGDVKIIEDYDQDGQGWGLIDAVRPRLIYPAPNIIGLSRAVPDPVSKEIEKSFAMFWSDLNSCANKLRTSVERLLDSLSVPTQQAHKTSGKLQRLDLNGRIALYAKQNVEHAETMTALRIVGNLGSHGSEEVSREAVLDAYEIYEDALLEICDKRKTRMETLRKKIIDSKGVY